MLGRMSSVPLLFLLVPAILIVSGLVTVARGIGRVLTVQALQARGRRARGRVVGAHVQVSRSSSRSRGTRSMVETIEFTTADGRTVRAVPAVSDVGLLDRSGTEVEVLYDDQRPDRFIAPKDGDRMRTGALLAAPLMSLVMIAVMLVFVVVTWRMVGALPGWPLSPKE